jgi:uncharacterized membrane protein
MIFVSIWEIDPQEIELWAKHIDAQVFATKTGKFISSSIKIVRVLRDEDHNSDHNKY